MTLYLINNNASSFSFFQAKNFVPGKENQSSKMAQSVVELQEALPMARVVYCSATGVTDIQNVAFMSRLGLW